VGTLELAFFGQEESEYGVRNMLINGLFGKKPSKTWPSQAASNVHDLIFGER
jgi:hypothetical protein